MERSSAPAGRHELAGLEVHSGEGYGRQFALLVPNLNLTIATTGELNVEYGTADAHQVAIIGLIGRLLQALQG